MQVRESAQSLLLERIWHRSWGKGGPMQVREAYNPFSWKGYGIGLGANGDQIRPPHTRPWPNPLSPPAVGITAPRFASRTITLTDKTQVGMLVPVVLSGDRHLNSSGIWPPHTHPWPNLLSPPESQITKNASLQKHDQTPTLSRFQTYPLSHHQKTQQPRRPPKA